MTGPHGRAPRLGGILFAAGVSAVLVPAVARAQTITFSGTYATRSVDSVDAGVATRTLNPYGINFADCTADMVMHFPVVLSGFGGGNDVMQVWATYGTNADCAFGGRGNGGSATTCWLVDPGPTQIADGAYTANIPVRALVAPEDGSLPAAGVLEGDQSADACTHQPSLAGVPVTLWFLPLDASTGALDTAGSPYEYPSFTADVVGPPAPVGVSIADGDTLFTVNWAANVDGDTQGYDVFIDPPPGSHPEGGSALATQSVYCPDSGGSSVSSADADDGSSDDEASEDAALDVASSEASSSEASVDAQVEASIEASVDATLDAADDAETVDATVASVDAGADVSVPDSCVVGSGGGSVPSGTGTSCTSAALSASPTLQVSVSVDPTDDADLALASTDAAIESGLGGIASLTCEYLEGASSCAAGTPAYASPAAPTVTGSSTTSLTITGLTNNVYYNVSVAAVDGSGNVGIQSALTSASCDYPAPINDFYKTYRLDGGGAGGGFCTLEAVGAPTGASIFSMAFGAIAFGLVRRRSRRRR